MGFAGFTNEDFDVFSIEGFDERMPILKARVTPKLTSLGGTLQPLLEAEAGEPIVVHVAQHLRRSVNPAEETWVAFSRSPRAYKPFIHTRVAINGFGIKVSCYLEEDADDKPVFTENLKRNARTVARILAAHPEIRSHDSEANYGKMLDGRNLRESEVRALADRLAKVKSQHVNFAIRIPRTLPVSTSSELAATALDHLKTLLPIYRLGIDQKVVL